jgi:hypothetical protein
MESMEMEGSNSPSATAKKRGGRSIRGGQKRKWLPKSLCLPADEISYRPADHWPDYIQEYFLAYARTGTRTGACKLIGRSTDIVYAWEQEDPGAWIEEENRAYETIREKILGVSIDQAVSDGTMPGTTMRIFLLKGEYPDRYGDKSKVQHSGQVDVNAWSRIFEVAEEED